MNNLEINLMTPQMIVVGIENFKDLILQSDVFVDKTLFIKELLENGGNVILITRPRRWGKSMNMDMLKCFLSIEVDEKGIPLPEEKCINRKLFLGGEVDLGLGETKLLKPLKISSDTKSLRRLGQYPLIHISFKECKADTYDVINDKIKQSISDLFKNHSYLKHSEKLTDDEKDLLSKYIKNDIDANHLHHSLRFLSEILFKHFSRRVYILIDEYDSPINHVYSEFGFGSKELKAVVTIFQSMFGASLKGNTSLERGVITGILRIAKANLFSGINNVSENTLLDKKFIKSYGFTQEEVDELVTQVPTETNPEEIKSWYNGYTFGGETIYNPWSIMQCLSNDGALDTYWIDSGGTGLLTKSFLSDEMQQHLQTLLKGGDITVPIAKQISFEDIDKPIGFFSLLLFAGYLNPYAVNAQKNIYSLSIPNQEVSRIYELRVIDWVTSKIKSDITEYYLLITLLAANKPQEFKATLQQLLQNATSFYQTGEKNAELFYSGFMLGLINTISTTHIIDSERESGKGRPDIVLIPKPESQNNLAIIIEYKVSKTQEDSNLSNIVQEALVQIQSKNYDTKLKEFAHISQILKIGMAFAGKEMEMEWVIDKI